MSHKCHVIGHSMTSGVSVVEASGETATVAKGCAVAVLIPCEAWEEAIASGNYADLALDVGAAVAACLVIPDDYALSAADRLGGQSEDDDTTHRARKRGAIEAEIKAGGGA